MFILLYIVINVIHIKHMRTHKMTLKYFISQSLPFAANMVVKNASTTFLR